MKTLAKHRKWLTWILVLASLLGMPVIVQRVTEASLVIMAPMWLALGIFLSSLILPIREMIAVIALTKLCFVYMLFQVPREFMGHIEMQCVFSVAIGAMALASNYMRSLAEKQIEDERAKVVHASRLSLIGEMAGGLAHEINTPLTIIQFKIDELNDVVSAHNKIKDDVRLITNTMENTVMRIAKSVRALRTFARDAQNGAEGPFELQSVVNETLALCRERYLHGGVKLDTEPLQERVVLIGHKNQVSQVILNLLNNAFDAATAKTEGWIRLEFRVFPQTVQIHIVDSGTKIAKEIQNKLFVPFFTSKAIGQGTGLSLSVSKGIVERHLGRIFYDETSPNTRFVIEFPRAG